MKKYMRITLEINNHKEMKECEMAWTIPNSMKRLFYQSEYDLRWEPRKIRVRLKFLLFSM